MNIELFVRISPRTFPTFFLQKFEESVEKNILLGCAADSQKTSQGSKLQLAFLSSTLK